MASQVRPVTLNQGLKLGVYMSACLLPFAFVRNNTQNHQHYALHMYTHMHMHLYINVFWDMVFTGQSAQSQYLLQ